MTLVLKKAPSQARAVVGQALRDLWHDALDADVLGGAAIDLSDPLPVYRLGLDQIGPTGGLGRAIQVGWRYLIERGDGEAALADVSETAGEAPRFASLSRSEHAKRLIEAAHLAEEVARTGAGPFEARVLDVPALNLSALWLAGDRNVFIPYLDLKRLRGGKIGVEQGFEAMLFTRAQALARASSKAEDQPRLHSEGA